jgi:protein TonB
MPEAPATANGSRFQVHPTGPGWRIASVAGGAAVSFVIFFAIAEARRIGPVRPLPSLDDIVSVAVEPPPPPPPPPEEHFHDEGSIPNAIQMDSAPSNSPIRIDAVPIALETIAAPVIRAVAAMPTIFSPHLLRDNLGFDSNHVWEPNQVDQKPYPIYRKIPDIPTSLMRTIADPRITLLFVVNADGTVENMRVIRPVEPTFDELVTDAIKAWQFSPAVKKGRKVRCWVQEPVLVKSPNSSPFLLN